MLSILSISSCKKENSDSNSQDLTSVEESAIAGETFADAFSDISSLSSENDGLFSITESSFQAMPAPAALSNSCTSLTISPQGKIWPKTITLDFGTGCTVENITRKGKIIAIFTDRFRNTGAKISVTFENFYVNDHKIEGIKTIINNG